MKWRVMAVPLSEAGRLTADFFEAALDIDELLGGLLVAAVRRVRDHLAQDLQFARRRRPILQVDGAVGLETLFIIAFVDFSFGCFEP